MRRVEPGLVGLALLLAACTAPMTSTPTPSDPADKSEPIEQPSRVPVETGGLELIEVDVIHVDDGDSLIVEVDGREERVRLIGINAPERDECLGDESRRALGAALGDVVVLGLEAESRDQFERILAHVFADDVYVNLVQVEAGLAITFSDDNAFSDVLGEAQAAAEEAEVGMWSPEVCGGGPLPDLRVTRIDENPPGPDEDALGLEVVEITNESGQTVDMGGFVLRDESTANRFVFPADTALEAGDSLEVTAGCDPGSNQVAWCADGPVWNNGGDTALLLDPAGRVVDHYGY